MFISSGVFRTTVLGLVRLAKLYHTERPLCLQNYESNAPTELVESFIQLCCSHLHPKLTQCCKVSWYETRRKTVLEGFVYGLHQT